MLALGYSLEPKALERRTRRLATYARYRVSEKGRERTLRYNSSTAHREASRRWRLCHVPGPDSSQDRMGRWTNPMKIDPADKVALGVQAQRCGGWAMFWLYRGADTTAAQHLLSQWGLSHQLLPGPPDADLFDASPDTEEVWNCVHATFGREFKTEHARAFWTKKHQRFETRRQSQ